jgi:Carboxypeptidase regulatory-like domain
MKFFINSILLTLLFVMSAAVALAQETSGAKGRVCTTRNRGIAQVSVLVLQNGKEVKSAVTNNKGEFQIDGLKSGKYDFVFKKDGFNSGTMKNVELGNKKIRDLGNSLVLESDDGTLVIIKGLVFDEEGRSIPGAEVLIEKVLGDNNFEKIKTASTSFGGDVTDRGEFTFKLPEGKTKYRITASFKGKSASKEIAVESAAVYRTAISLNLESKKDQ